MKITIVTFYRKDAETFVGAVKGGITSEQEKQMAQRFALKMEDGDSVEMLGFQEFELAESVDTLGDLLNAFPDARYYDGTK